MKRSNAKRRRVEDRAAKERSIRRPSRVERGRTKMQQSAAAAASFARWSPTYPWDGQHLGAGLVDSSQLACECGACPGCQSRVG